ncbi:hypothetical protein B4U79_03154, partial [Dinothrombium tinctorium]
MKNLKAPPTTSHNKQQIFIPQNLQTCSHVFLRDDRISPSLKQLYTGPHKVVERKERNFKIDVNGKNVVVTIDRLKPGFILNDDISDPPSKLYSSQTSLTAPTTK